MHAWKVTAISIRTGEQADIEVDADSPVEAFQNAAASVPAPLARYAGRRGAYTEFFTLDDDLRTALADDYSVTTDQDAVVLLEAALGTSGDEPAITGPYELAVDLLADKDGEIDGWRFLLLLGGECDQPWLASGICRVSYLDLLDEPDDAGGIYHPVDVLNQAVQTANAMLLTYQRAMSTTDRDAQDAFTEGLLAAADRDDGEQLTGRFGQLASMLADVLGTDPDTAEWLAARAVGTLEEIRIESGAYSTPDAHWGVQSWLAAMAQPSWRTWRGPGNILHIIFGRYPCATCGRRHRDREHRHTQINDQET